MKFAPYTVIYEDERIIAVNKAPGVSIGGERWRVFNAAEGGEKTPARLDRLLAARAGAKLWTVHRIDKDTSGLVVFARDAKTHRKLSRAFERRAIRKTYLAVVHGRPAWPEGKTACALSLIPDGNKKHLTIVDRYRGKPSLTAFNLLFSAGNYSLVEAAPETGRTHQIRVHLAALGHPVVCDELYGKARPPGRSKTQGVVGLRCGPAPDSPGAQTGRGFPPDAVYLSSFKRKWRGDAFEERPLLARLGLHAQRLILPADAETPELCLEAPPARDIAALARQMEQNR